MSITSILFDISKGLVKYVPKFIKGGISGIFSGTISDGNFENLDGEEKERASIKDIIGIDLSKDLMRILEDHSTIGKTGPAEISLSQKLYFSAYCKFLSSALDGFREYTYMKKPITLTKIFQVQVSSGKSFIGAKWDKSHEHVSIGYDETMGYTLSLSGMPGIEAAFNEDIWELIRINDITCTMTNVTDIISTMSIGYLPGYRDVSTINKNMVGMTSANVITTSTQCDYLIANPSCNFYKYNDETKKYMSEDKGPAPCNQILNIDNIKMYINSKDKYKRFHTFGQVLFFKNVPVIFGSDSIGATYDVKITMNLDLFSPWNATIIQHIYGTDDDDKDDSDSSDDTSSDEQENGGNEGDGDHKPGDDDDGNEGDCSEEDQGSTQGTTQGSTKIGVVVVKEEEINKKIPAGRRGRIIRKQK